MNVCTCISDWFYTAQSAVGISSNNFFKWQRPKSSLIMHRLLALANRAISPCLNQHLAAVCLQPIVFCGFVAGSSGRVFLRRPIVRQTRREPLALRYYTPNKHFSPISTPLYRFPEYFRHSGHASYWYTAISSFLFQNNHVESPTQNFHILLLEHLQCLPIHDCAHIRIHTKMLSSKLEEASTDRVFRWCLIIRV